MEQLGPYKCLWCPCYLPWWLMVGHLEGHRDGESMDQGRWMMLPESEGGGGPEYPKDRIRW